MQGNKVRSGEPRLSRDLIDHLTTVEVSASHPSPTRYERGPAARISLFRLVTLASTKQPEAGYRPITGGIL